MPEQIPILQIKFDRQTLFPKEAVNRFDQKSIPARKSSNVVPVSPQVVIGRKLSIKTAKYRPTGRYFRNNRAQYSSKEEKG